MGNNASQEQASSVDQSRTSHRKSLSQDVRRTLDHADVPVIAQSFEQTGSSGPSQALDIGQTATQKEQDQAAQPSETKTVAQHFSKAPDAAEEPSYQHREHAESDVDMTGTSRRPAFLRKNSAIVLETEVDDEADHLRSLKVADANARLAADTLGGDDERPSLSRANSGEEVELGDKMSEEPAVQTTIYWRQGGNKVYVTGSFASWQKMIRLNRQEDGNFAVTLWLAPGTHRMRFVVDNELRCSDDLPTATDSMGNLVNYLEVSGDVVMAATEEDETSLQHQTTEGTIPGRSDEQATAGAGASERQSRPPLNHRMSSFEDDKGVRYTKFSEDDEKMDTPALEYTKQIPAVFADAEAMDKLVASEFVPPPYLPPHLEGVILNSNSTEKDNNSVLPIPNHVVLNHLATTSIKHNVLAVASISRYSRKYVTQVLYVPL